MSLELVAEHLDGELAGMETCRVYLDLASASDVVTNISGSEEFALELNTTKASTSTHSVLPRHRAERHGAGCVPALAFDSYITIGVDGPAGAGEQNASFIPTIPGGNRLWPRNLKQAITW